ncbi:hypothetical protein [Granulicella mallensis]|jgi:hypothetical protein|uniref:Uncharacterized protein n=1 Tax=Granulicella mallensis TaxID=940614 RepID=A0A7W8EB07_9BACT|nr:hypothetical protein [Granulicella mallensis]MBB5066183.1 hypothetical protein [Granulicella mallensis]
MSTVISENVFFAEKPTEEKSTDEQARTEEAPLETGEDFHAIPLSMVADAEKFTEEKAPEKLNPALHSSAFDEDGPKGLKEGQVGEF